MNVNIYHKHKDIIITTFIIASRAYLQQHVLKMSGYADKLVSLGITIPIDLGIHRVLQSLPPSYKSFVMNYNMQVMKKSLPELLSMLKTAEVEIKKEHQVLMINRNTGFKKDKKGNGREVRAASRLPYLKRNPELDLSLIPSATIVRGLATGSATAPSIW